MQGLGIDPKRYWLLIDLFGELSERGEVMDQLGTHGVALKFATWLNAAFAGLIAVAMALAQPGVKIYLAVFLGYTGFILFSTLLSEAGNSLVNPVEGLILAHQPIDGATYTAAKLTHLLRIILYFAPGLNLAPAVVGLLVRGARWFYPLVHLSATLGVGLLAGLLCCALYGWLMRLLPARRLKAAGQLAGALPFLLIWTWRPIRDALKRSPIFDWTPPPEVRVCLWIAGCAAASGVVAFGIRSLSADYLIRVSDIMHGGSSAGSRARRSWIGDIAARFFGGQPARGGYAYVSCMARRDFQFGRQIAFSLIGLLAGAVPLVARTWRADPFARGFAAAHVLPHLCGLVLFFVCSFLPFGTDYKGSWVFLLAPGEALGRFARGVYAALLLVFVAIPHGLMLAAFAWVWGIAHAALFVGYSAAACAFYLALELRLVDGIPFTRQLDAQRGAAEAPVVILGAVVVAIAVATQYFFVFRSPALVAAATAVIAPAAYFLTRSSLDSLETAMRFHLSLLSRETGTLYREVG
jgi:hypothetical protein